MAQLVAHRHRLKDPHCLPLEIVGQDRDAADGGTQCLALGREWGGMPTGVYLRVHLGKGVCQLHDGVECRVRATQQRFCQGTALDALIDLAETPLYLDELCDCGHWQSCFVQ